MGVLWFSIVAFMLAAYVVLDGFDLGVGIVYLFVAETEQERQLTLRAIGPVWDGNEGWLAGAAGDAVFRLSAAVRLGLQRLLSATDDRVVAVDRARHQHRAAQPLS